MQNTQPTWSPDGKRIAFERGGDIYVAQATGAPRERRVLKGGEQPTWTSAPRARRAARASACAAAPCSSPPARRSPGALTATLLRAGRRVARRTVTAATGGTVTVRLRRPSGRWRRATRPRYFAVTRR